MIKMQNKHQNFNLSKFLLIIVIGFLAIQFAYFYRMYKTTGNEFIDTDCYMRLVRVTQLAEGGGWYDQVIHRSNAPYGEALHWSRLFDMILILGILPLKYLLGLAKAVELWGILISPLLGIATLYALIWAVKPIFDRQKKVYISFLFVTQMMVQQYFEFGRPDHHSLLILLFALFLGYAYRLACMEYEPSAAWKAGLVAALSVWVSVESLTSVAMLLFLLAIQFISGSRNAIRKLIAFSGSLLLFSITFLLVERPIADIFKVEYDKVSIVHIFAFFLMAVSFIIIKWVHKDTVSSKAQRMLSLSVSAIASGILVNLMYPGFLHGPFASVNPRIVSLWLGNVSEVQPLLKPGLSGVGVFLSCAGMAVLSIPYILYQLKNGRQENQRLAMFIAVGMLVFAPLSFYQVRWVAYLQVLSLIPLAGMMDSFIGYFDLLRSRWARSLLRITFILFFCLGLYTLGSYMQAFDNNKSSANYEDITLKPLCTWLDENEASLGSNTTILAFIDFGPEILYRTPYNVIASPYHRNDKGMLYLHEIMNLKDMGKVHFMLEERKVGLILLVPRSLEDIYYNTKKDKDMLYQKLLRAETPAWLKKVELPERLKDFSLYQVSYTTEE